MVRAIDVLQNDGRNMTMEEIFNQTDLLTYLQVFNEVSKILGNSTDKHQSRIDIYNIKEAMDRAHRSNPSTVSEWIEFSVGEFRR